MNGREEPGFRSVILPFMIFTAIWGSTWIVIIDQLGTVPPQWSVTYRFVIAAAAMALFARAKGERLPLNRGSIVAVLFIAVTQFTINFNSVYLAERHITSGLVATVFALLLIPNSLLGWAFLGQRPSGRFVWSSLVAVAGMVLLFAHELGQHPARADAVMFGIALTIIGMLGASAANVFQARPAVRAYPLFALLAWSMALGALLDALIALVMTGPPVFEARAGYWLGLLYLALAASALAFGLYFPVVRKIGPAKAAYSSAIVPVIALSLSTLFEDYRWTPTAVLGALLAIGGMLGALSRSRSPVPAPDAG
jgi:drug/metabolite transporter (DMT)-like permease